MAPNEMSLIMSIVDKITAPSRTITAAMDKVKLKVTGLNESMKQFDGLNQAAGKIQSAGVGLMATGGIIAGLSLAPALDAERYKKSLAELAALSGVTADELQGKFSDTLINLSVDTGVSTDDLVKSLQKSVSEGLSLDTAMGIVSSQAKAAKAGVTDIMSTMDVGGKIAKAYNMPLQDAVKMNDILFASMRKGGATFDSMAGQLDKVLAPAAAAGVSLENIQASVMQFSKSGVGLDKAYSGVASAIEQLSAPSAKAAGVFRQLGVSVNAEALKKGDLIGVMELLKDSMQGLSKEAQKSAISQMFQGADTQKFALDYLANAEAYKTFNNELKNSSDGSMMASYNDMAKSTRNSTENLRNTFNTLKVVMGSAVLPVLEKIIGGFLAVLTPVINFMNTHKKFATIIMTVIVALSGIVFMLGVMSFAIGLSIKMYTNLKMAAGVMKILSSVTLGAVRSTLMFTAALLTNPLTWIVVGIMVVIGGLILLQKKFNIFGKLFNFIKSGFAAVKAFIVSFFDTLKESPVKAIKMLIAKIISLNPIVFIFRKLIGGLSKLKVFDGIMAKFTAFLSWLKDIGDRVKSFFTGMFTGIKADPIGVIKSILFKIISFNPLVWLFRKLAGNVKDLPLFGAVMDKFNAVYGWLKSKVEGVKNLFKNPLGAIKTVAFKAVSFSPAALAYKKLAGVLNSIPLFKGISGKFAALQTELGEKAGRVKKVFVSMFSDIRADPAGALKSMTAKLKDALKNINLMDAGRQMIDSFIEGIKSKFAAITGVVDRVKGFFSFGSKEEPQGKKSGGSGPGLGDGIKNLFSFGKKDQAAPVKDFAPQVGQVASSSVSSSTVDNSIKIEFSPSYGVGTSPAKAEEDARKLADMIRKEQERQRRLEYA